MQPDKYGPKTLESFEPLIQLQVREIVYDPSKWDDCAQEARIKVWQVLRDRPGASRQYIAKATKRAILTASQMDRYTGHSGRRGKAVDPLRRGAQELPHQMPAGTNLSLTSVETAQEVRAAVRELPEFQRRYVFERFYEDRPHKQFSAGAGTWYRKDNGIRDRLRSLLSEPDAA